MNLFSVISLTLLLLSGFLLGTAHSTSRERIIALIAFAVSGVVALVQVSVLGLTPISPKDFSPEELFIHFRPYVEFAFCCMGFVCAGLSSLVDCQTRSFRSMLLFVASAMLFLHVYHNIVFAIALWGLSSYLLYRELSYSKEQEIGVRAARLFYYYHGISLVALTAGLILFRGGFPTLGSFLLVVAVSVRSGLFPFHGWLLPAFETLPLGVVFTFFGPQISIPIVLMMLHGEGGTFWQAAFSLGGLATALYGGSLALAPKEVRRSLAYLFMSQSGLIYFGFMSNSFLGLTASIITWLALCLSLIGFAMTYGCLEARKGAISLSAPSGCYQRTPKMAVTFLLCGLASVGIPGTVLFLSEDLLLQGLIEKLPVMAGLLVVAITLCAINVLRLYFYLFNGSRTHQGEEDFTSREFSVVNVLFILLTVGSLMPSIIFQ